MAEKKNCENLLGEIMSFLDGELDEDGCRRVTEHLRGCPRCEACREILSRSRSLCKERAPLSEEHRQSLLARLRGELER